MFVKLLPFKPKPIPRLTVFNACFLFRFDFPQFLQLCLLMLCLFLVLGLPHGDVMRLLGGTVGKRLLWEKRDYFELRCA